MNTCPILYIVIPCYNEEKVLPVTSPMFRDKIKQLTESGTISDKSRILFVNDGSKDRTWEIISDLSENDTVFQGISLSRNRGHQNAVLAGMMEAKEKCDITITIDCDGQDDINAMDAMVKAYTEEGCDIVYGVRASRASDSVFKRETALGYYRFLKLLGVEVVHNHADYRLLSTRVLSALSEYREVNLYLRGLIPLIGFKSKCVSYDRNSRIAGESHYPLRKMLSLAFNGITSFSIKPIRMVMLMGFVIAFISFLTALWALIAAFAGEAIHGWTSTIIVVCLISGIQLISMGIIGEYIGKIYLEVKQRPRYIVSERTENKENV